MFQIFVEKNEYFFIPKKCVENFAKETNINKIVFQLLTVKVKEDEQNL